MNSLAALAIFVAAVAAGTINAVVGSGSLITFPTLLALGYAPAIANVSNNIGVIPGNITASFGYRAELAGQRDRLLRLGVASFAGALAGAIALLALPAGVFKLVVPVLIIAACVLVILQPKLVGLGRGAEPRPLRPHRAGPDRRGLPDRRLRRLLWRALRAYCWSACSACSGPTPAADQCGQERARHDRERGRGRGFRHLRRRRLAGGRPDRGRIRPGRPDRREDRPSPVAARAAHRHRDHRRRFGRKANLLSLDSLSATLLSVAGRGARPRPRR